MPLNFCPRSGLRNQLTSNNNNNHNNLMAATTRSQPARGHSIDAGTFSHSVGGARSASYVQMTQPVPSHPALLHKDSSFHGATTVQVKIAGCDSFTLNNDYVEEKQGVRFEQQTEPATFSISCKRTLEPEARYFKHLTSISSGNKSVETERSVGTWNRARLFPSIPWK